LPMETKPKLCRLQATLGTSEVCPAGACPFWEPGGAVLEGRCALERIELAGRPELASFLLRMRRDLGDAAREELYRLLDTDDADGG